MKKTLVLLSIVFSVILWGCEKESISRKNIIPTLVQNANQYFTDSVLNQPSASNSANPRASYQKSVLWEQASIVTVGQTKSLFAPIKYSKEFYFKSTFGGKYYYSLSEFSRLLVYKDQQDRYHANVVTYFPDSNFLGSDRRRFTGFASVEDWEGNYISKFQFNPKGSLCYQPNATIQDASILVTICNQISGYNYSPDDPYNGYAWSESEECTYNYLSTPVSQFGLANTLSNPSGGGGAAGNNSPTDFVNKMVLPRGNNPIINVAQYIKCFQNAQEYSYSISLDVAQPVPGSRTPYTLGTGIKSNIYNIGHTYLVFSQTSPGGITTRRCMGFYPANFVSPLNPTDAGSLNDDEGHGFNVSLTFAVDGQSFMNILHAAAMGNNSVYDLNLFNCTTWSLYCLAYGGIDIHSQTGTWPMGGGLDPGDLGEDIRGMTLSQNMTRSTIANYTAQNVGICP